MTTAHTNVTGSDSEPPRPSAELPAPRSGILHFELFVGPRSGAEVRVPCRCSMRSAHTYQEWLIAGRPPVSGKPRRGSAARRAGLSAAGD